MGKFIDGLLPWVIFPSLAVAGFYCIIYQTEVNGLGAALKEHCPATIEDSFPFRLTYSGVDGLDSFLCVLAATFHSAFTPTSLQFLAYFLTQATPVIVFIYLDSARRRSHFSLRFPVIFVSLMQLVSFGATFSFYWLPFITTGAAKVAGSKSTVISKADAEAIAFGNIVGIALPTVGMLVLHNPYMTVIWQFVPVLASVATLIYLTFRSPKNHPQSGFKDIRNNYVIVIIVNIVTHLALVGPKLADVDALKAFFLPSLSINTSNASVERLVLSLLQWDLVFGLGASLLGTLWFARSARQLVLLVVWNTVGTVLLGPGAVFATIALWRESRLHPVEGKKKQ
ncbi:hypothetical protein PQX77_004352 [Marasmius sp. AFHP31]|nr:hypothetical protein PQX77_004352 [Marasmius sp. AFHP31]